MRIHKYNGNNLEVRLPDMQQQSWEEWRERASDKRANKERRSKRSLNSMCFQMFCGSGRLKSMLAKAVGAELFGRMREKITRRCRRRSTCQSQNTRKTQPPSAFGSWKSACGCTYGSQNVKKRFSSRALLEDENSKSARGPRGICRWFRRQKRHRPTQKVENTRQTRSLHICGPRTCCWCRGGNQDWQDSGGQYPVQFATWNGIPIRSRTVELVTE